MVARKSCAGRVSITRLLSFIGYTSVILIFFSFHSCAPIYYAPNTSNVPLLKEKGEVKVNGFYSSCEDISGAELQGAVAVSKNIGVMLNTAYMSGDDGIGYLVEGGAGYYKVFSEKWVFESYGGLGFGGAKNDLAEWGGSSKVNFTKCFVQPSVGLTTKNFDIGIASRFSAVFMNVNDYAPGDYYEFSIDYLRAHPNSYLWEPSGFIAFGVRDAKFRLQLTLSENLNNKELNQEEINLALGVSFNFAPKKK